MSKSSRKFKVPDELANLYDFANSLDLRHFVQHGVVHEQGDEIATPQSLAAWMTERGLLPAGARVTPELLRNAQELRSCLRDFLQREPAGRRDKGLLRVLNEVTRRFPLVAQIGLGGEGMLRALRDDALSGLSAIVAEFYDGSRNGSLDRLKMCAAEECRRVFFDRSKPATRRWCMSTLCGNRIKTRSYRERRRAAK